MQTFVCAGASHVHDMSNLNQAEIEELMNELPPPHPLSPLAALGVVTQIPARTEFCGHSLCNCMAELFQHAGGRCEWRSSGLGLVHCVHIQGVQSLLVWCWRFCSVGKDGGNGSTQRCYNCDGIWREKEKIICPNCCLLSSEIIGFLNVWHEDP